MSHPHPPAQESRIEPWRIGALVAGILLALSAFYIFYFHPWLGLTLPIDGWLDRQRCLVNGFCGEQSAIPHHLGVLATLASLLFFAIGLAGERGVWSRAKHVTPWRTVWMTVLALAGIGCICVQTFQALIQGSPPSPVVWLCGVLALGAAAVLWDTPRPGLLAQTSAGIMLAVGIAATLIGIGVAFADPVEALWLLLPSVTLAVVGSVWADRVGGALERADHLLMLGLGLAALMLGLLRIDSWRYAFIGDEWGFFELATTLLHRPELHTLFSVVDANAYHTVFSSSLQAWIMRLAGENIYGWRLSSLLPQVLSVPAVYVFVHWLSGRTAAIAAAGLLAASHMLLSFSMVAYNNTQALLPLTLGLGFLAYAQRRDSALRLYLLGAVLGSSFLVFGLARLAILPVGILALLIFWTSWQRALLSIVATGAGAVAVSTPILFNLSNWRGLLKATPVQSEALDKGGAIGAQVTRNAVAGAQTFLVSDHNTHFVAGPHTDPLSAVLVLVGLAATLVAWRQRHAVAWLFASLAFWLAVSAIQQYEWVSTTRMYILVPIYAIYAGLGVAAIAGLFLADSRRKRSIFAGAVVLLALLLNQLHITQVALAQSRIPAEALLVREFQRSAAIDGSGMPVYIVWDQPYTARENMILRAYGSEPSRIRFITATEALELAALCENERPQMLLIHDGAPSLDAIRAHVRACWPLHEEMALKNEGGETLLHRMMTLPGVQDAVQPRRQRSDRRPRPNRLEVPDPGDLIVDGDGHIFVLSKEAPAIWHFDENGRLDEHFALQQKQPSALALTPDGLLLVGNSGPDSALVWYDRHGNVVRRLPASGALGVPAGLAVTAEGGIYVADAALGQVARLNPNGQIEAVYTGGGELQQPLSVTVADDEMLWVLDGNAGQWFKLSAEDEVVASVATDRTSAAEPARLLMVEDGTLLFSQPERRRVDHVAVDGTLLDGWGGLHRPSSLGVDAQGRLFVVENQLDEVTILPPVDIGLSTATVSVRSDESMSKTDNDLRGTFDDEFLSPLSPLPLVQDDDVVAAPQQSYLPSAQIGGMTRPRAVVAGIDPADGTQRIYVGDAAGAGLAVLDENGDLIKMADAAPPPLVEVSDVATDSLGRVYVLDSAAGQLHRFAPDGSYSDSLPGSSGLFGDARGLFVDASGDIWIASTRRGVIVRLTSEGEEISATDVVAGDDTQPVDVLVDRMGNLYVVDARRARLLHLTTGGDLLGAWSLAPFNSADAAHLAMDSDNNIYVTQPEQGTILRLSAEDAERSSWRVTRPDGSAAKPIGITIAENGDIWTVDVDGSGVIVVSVK